MSVTVERFERKLHAIRDDSRDVINMVAQLAHQCTGEVEMVVRAVSKFVWRQPFPKKLYGFYVLDSIIKIESASTADFCRHFANCIVGLFLNTFTKADNNIRKRLYKCRSTWQKVLPQDILHHLDLTVRDVDPSWPVIKPESTPSPVLGKRRSSINENVTPHDASDRTPSPKRVCFGLEAQSSPVNNKVSSNLTDSCNNVIREEPKRENADVTLLLKEIRASGLLSKISLLAKPAPPAHHALFDNLRSYNFDAVEALHAPRTACPDCGVAFEDMKSEAFKRHIDTHIQKRLRARTVKKAEPHSWYMPINTWLAFDELTEVQKDPAQIIAKAVDDYSDSDSSSGCASPSDAPADDSVNKTCPACHDRFEHYFDDDEEEWRYKNTTVRNGMAVHRSCVSHMNSTASHAVKKESIGYWN